MSAKITVFSSSIPHFSTLLYIVFKIIRRFTYTADRGFFYILVFHNHNKIHLPTAKQILAP